VVQPAVAELAIGVVPSNFNVEVKVWR
jgi:hypothetical protein